MPQQIRRIMSSRWLILACVSLLGLPLVASSQKYRDAKFNGLELAQLPKYCYPQYVDEKLAGNPMYQMPRGCGDSMNHYCPGLVNLIRAQNSASPRAARKEELGGAITNFEYTLHFMPRGCLMRAEAETSLARAKSLQMTLR